MSNSALIIGAGPAGLMAAERLLAQGAQVQIFDAKPSIGRKFLMAGKNRVKTNPKKAPAPFSKPKGICNRSMKRFGVYFYIGNFY